MIRLLKKLAKRTPEEMDLIRAIRQKEKMNNQLLGQIQEIKTLAFQLKSDSVSILYPEDEQKVERILFLADKTLHEFSEHFDD